jgi:hypothetical protein
VRGRLPKGLEVCEAGCAQPWDYWPVFGGLAIGFGTGSRWAETVRLRWTADGTHWEALAVPPGLLQDYGSIFSDGSATGAFAAVYHIGRGRLWRTVDRGRTWRKVTGIANWPDLVTIESGAGRFLAVVDDPARLFVSDDGWAWAEVTPLAANLIGGAPGDSLSIGMIRGDAAGFVATVEDYDTDESWFTTSVDERTWTEPRSLAGTACDDVVRVPSGYLCLSDVYSNDPATGIWASPDGAAWRYVGHHDGTIELLPEGGFIASTWAHGRLSYSYSVDGVAWSRPVNSPKHAYFEARSGRTLFVWRWVGLWSARLPDAPGDAVRSRHPSWRREWR